MEKLERSTLYDVIKGIAIWLVVLGHCLQTFLPNWESNIIVLGIYAFHMPLFMTVSGKFFLKSAHKTSIGTFIKRKFYRLYLPSLFWGLFCAIIFCGGKWVTRHVFDMEFSFSVIFTGMWFLTVLFFFSVIGAFIEKYAIKIRYLVWFVIFVLLYFCPCFWMRNEMLFLLPFFVTAISISGKDWDKIPWWIGVFSLIAYFCLLKIYSFDYSLYKMDDDFWDIDYHTHSIIRYTIGAFGCLLSIFVCKWIVKIPYLCKALAYLGTISLPIYVLHQKFLWINFVTRFCLSSSLQITIISFSLLGATLVTYFILHKSTILRFIMFGES